MNFLSPLFLLGAVAILGPVLFHLVRRTTKDRVRFPSLMFLQPAPPRLTKRSRLEHWLLLMLRAAALGLLALAFARPFFRSQAEDKPLGAGGRRTVILLDTSASMQREDLWAKARSEARDAVASAAEAELAILAFHRSTTTLVSFEAWRSTPMETRQALALSRIDSANLTWDSTNLADAVLVAAEMLADSPDHAVVSAERELVVVSDLQEGAKLTGLQGYEWPRGVKVRLRTVRAEKPGNTGLILAAESSAAAAPRDGQAGVRLQLVNSPDSIAETFQIGWANPAGDAFSAPAQDIYVPPGQTRMVTLPWSGPTVPGRVLLRGDGAPFDNLVGVAPLEPLKALILHAGAAPTPAGHRDALYFLKQAIPSSGTLTAEVADLGHSAPTPEQLKKAALMVVTGPIPPLQAAALAEHVKSGGTVLLALAQANPEMSATAAALIGSEMPLSEVSPTNGYAMLGQIDFGHPLFAPFADPRFSDFTKIRFWKLRRLSDLPNGKILAQFDNGLPALIEVSRGRGRIYILASGWTQQDSQLALSSKFPSLLANLLAQTSAVQIPPAQHLVGSKINRSLLAPAEAGSLTIHLPSNNSVTLSADTQTFDQTSQPGHYVVQWSGGSRTLAVNLDPAESRTAPLPEEELEKMGVPLASSQPAVGALTKPNTESLAGATEAETRQKLWRWFILTALAVLFTETVLSGWTARRSTSAHESVS